MTSIHFNPEAHDSLLTIASRLTGFTVTLRPGNAGRPRVIHSADDQGLWTVPAKADGSPNKHYVPSCTYWDELDRIVVL